MSLTSPLEPSLLDRYVKKRWELGFPRVPAGLDANDIGVVAPALLPNVMLTYPPAPLPEVFAQLRSNTLGLACSQESLLVRYVRHRQGPGDSLPIGVNIEDAAISPPLARSVELLLADNAAPYTLRRDDPPVPKVAKPKKPNSFLLFRQSYKPGRHIEKGNWGLRSILAGQAWRGLDDRIKDDWRSQAGTSTTSRKKRRPIKPRSQPTPSAQLNHDHDLGKWSYMCLLCQVMDPLPVHTIRCPRPRFANVDRKYV
ncbi:hypothetical protein V5O48_014911 [Marasmius crinis-equi]|uniref:HMG box domain-containing protein n=1 Tax=Marasmius crinis-equi TaxID=585013 RepID=A0ABR3EVZ3_9AGAR